jgi:hypothetical protein
LTKKEGMAFPKVAEYADIRDVARIHVEALTSAPESSVGRKRLLIASPHDGIYKKAVLFVTDARPELRDRLVDANAAPLFPADGPRIDLKRVEDVTGVKVDSYYAWKETILDTIDSLLAVERSWVSQGYEIEIPAVEDYGL